jgi:hypothetical protein
MSAPWMDEHDWKNIEPIGTVVPAEGFRFWYIDHRNWMLVPAVNKSEVDLFTKPDWMPHETNEAHCLRHDGFSSLDQDHVVPGVDCNCGFAALNAWTVAPNNSFGGVVGKVDLWGRIIIGDKGYRAQYAKPASFIHVSCHLCRQVLSYDDRVFMEPARVPTWKKGTVAPIQKSLLYCHDCKHAIHLGRREWEGTVAEVLENLSKAYDLPVESPAMHCKHDVLFRMDDGSFRCGVGRNGRQTGCGTYLNVLVLGEVGKDVTDD